MLAQVTVGQLLERWRAELVKAGLIAKADAVPAQPDQVAALEQRLGRPLPPTYREFLEVCGGMPVTGGLTCGLRPADRVGWFRDAERDWLEVWREIAEGEGVPNPDVELMDRALVVSEPGDQALLLDPDDIDDATGEWACYTFSNFAPGSNRVGGTFRAGLEHIYRDFVSSRVTASATLDEDEQVVEQAYQAILAGDLGGRDRLEELLPTSWRAWLLAAQFDAFGARPYESRDKSISVQILWWGTFAAVSVEQALADPVLVDDLMPLWVVRLIETGRAAEWELRRAPSGIAEPMASLLGQIADRTGPIADFGYSPVFAGHIDLAREQLTAGDLDAAWDTVRRALPTWTPMSRNHLAPLGLYYDKDLRRLLTPPAPRAATPGVSGPATSGQTMVTISYMAQPSEPQDTASVSRLAHRKQYSDRTLEVLTTQYPTSE